MVDVKLVTKPIFLDISKLQNAVHSHPIVDGICTIHMNVGKTTEWAIDKISRSADIVPEILFSSVSMFVTHWD